LLAGGVGVLGQGGEKGGGGVVGADGRVGAAAGERVEESLGLPDVTEAGDLFGPLVLRTRR
jgi:hypothetical protein